MKYVKMLGLAAVAAMALMAFVGASSASATELCSKAETTNCGNKAGRTIDATLAETAVLETVPNPGTTVLATCTISTVGGKAEGGGAGKPITGPIEKLEWGEIGKGCTKTVDTIKPGTLEINYKEKDNGTLTGHNAEVTVNTIFGSCVYGTGESKVLGEVIGGTPATITINTNVVKTGGNAACPAETRWTAKYNITEPSPLFIGES